MDVTSHRKSVEELELTLRESRGTEDRQALGQIDDVRVGGDPRAGTRKRFHWVGLADVLAHPPPELRLPAVARGQRGTTGVVIAADAPRLQHVGTVLGVAIEQHCEVLDGTQPAGAVTVARLEMGGQRSKPRLGQRAVNHLKQRPEQTAGRPRVLFRISATCVRDRIADKPARRREQHIGADAVSAAGTGPEHCRELLA